MVGMITSHEPVRGAMAREMHEHLAKIIVAKQNGSVKRARSTHKTNIQLVEMVDA